MSKPAINFCYSSASPRSVTQIQKGPLKINNLLDSLQNPQYEAIKLASSPGKDDINIDRNNQIYLKDEQTSIINAIDKQAKKQTQVASNASNAIADPQEIKSKAPKPLNIRLQQFEAIVQDPGDSDYSEQHNSNDKNKQPAKEDQKAQDKTVKQHEDKQNQIKGQDKSPEKRQYTFIVPPKKQQEKSNCCNLFGWCKKQKQRTYPISD